mmetsp:Transcript_1739/g.2373  ORF Transcript_1739/g.2373 Transcript_1739/m.2373 type:complete len:708 (-) Transcript_1739:132-2255(-)
MGKGAGKDSATTDDKAVEALSVGDTNELRKKLGLKPLKVVSQAEKAARAEAKQRARVKAAQKVADEAENEEARERIEKMRAKRLHKKKVTGKSLGDTLGKVTGGSAAEWIKRSRKIEQQKSMADKYAELDEEEAAYSAADLKGIKVQHDLADFKEGSEIILTLKDEPILSGRFDDVELNEQEDVLQNAKMALDEKYENLNEAKKKLLKPKYDVYGEKDDQGILPQYDEDVDQPKQKQGMRLGQEEPDSEEERQQRAARVREKLKKKKANFSAGKTLYSLNTGEKIISDYKKPEETVKFKKKRKKKSKKRGKRSIRTTTSLDFLPEPTDEERQAHHGSRSAGNTKLEKETAAKKAKKKKEADMGYLKALNKAESKSFVLPKKGNNDEDDDDDFDYEDKFDIQLQSALKRAREQGSKERIRSKDKEDKTAKLAASVLSVPKEEPIVKPEDEKKGENIILSATSEFCRGLEVTKEKEKASKMDIHNQEMMKDVTMALDGGGDVKAMEEEDDEDGDDEEEGQASGNDENNDDNVEFLHDEPLASGGLAAVLSLAKRRGLLEDALKKKKEADPAPNLNLEYPDEYGRPMSQKEAFRKLSHAFHGKAPGKLKREKKMKKYLEELKGKKIGNVDDPTHTISKLKSRQKASGKAFMVLDQKMTAEDREKLLKEAQKQAKRKRKKQKKKEKAAEKAARKKARSSSRKDDDPRSVHH